MREMQKKIKHSVLRTVGLVLIALLIGYSVGANAEPDDTSEPSMLMNHSEMMSTTYEVPDGVDVPAVTELSVTADNKAGWNVYFETENFTFTPQDASTEHTENEGHAHLHIDGVKVNRLYSNNYHVLDLEPGAHTFSVFLNTNDHREYVVDGAGTGMEVVVTQERVE